MDGKQLKRISKFISLVLRHRPETVGLVLDEAGWVSVDHLLAGMDSVCRGITREVLETAVRENDKQRFQFSEDGTRIRANQGHSVDVELGYAQSVPPKVLYHGTPTQFVQSIRRQGLMKQKRHHVHLHADLEIATAVGARRGTPVVLTIDASRMSDAGHVFYVSPNDVWLTDNVPSEFIQFPDRK